MAEPTTMVLGSLVVALVSGIAGKFVGSYNKVSSSQCGERRQACNNIIIEKLDSLRKLLEQHISDHSHNG